MMYNKPAEILLVDDAPDDVEIICQALKAQQRNSRLHVANSGSDALDYLYKRGAYTAAQRPDLVLLNLPGSNGRDVLTYAKANPGLCDIPIIVLTGGVALPADVIDICNLHANCYIAKPKDPKNYMDMLQSVLNFWLQVARLPSAITSQ